MAPFFTRHCLNDCVEFLETFHNVGTLFISLNEKHLQILYEILVTFQYINKILCVSELWSEYFIAYLMIFCKQRIYF